MPITDLTNTTWLIDNNIDNALPSGFTFNLNFTSDSSNYTIMTYNDAGGAICYRTSSSDVPGTRAYYISSMPIPPGFSAGWQNQAYRTIEITGGTDATNSDLIAWLQANATQQTAPTPTSETKNIWANTNQIAKAFLGSSKINKIYLGSTLIYGSSAEPEPQPVVEPYLTFSSPSSFTLNVVDNTKYWDGTLYYSTDTTTWNTWSGTTTLSSSSSGDTKYLYLRGTNNTYITGSSASNTKAKWVLTGTNISCDGNIENLLDYQTVANGNHPTMANHCYRNMFRGCTSLATTPSLPATTLATYCYYYMFYGCTSLTTAPSLPATTLADYCYSYMFQNCSGLTTAPALPATTLATRCYQYMFSGCKALTTAPVLPATTMANYCYCFMFYNCSGLTTAPSLPATTLANECYAYMFYGCTALTIAPTLPATTLAQYCYEYMFYGCTALTIVSTTLPATTLATRCYQYMFSGCKALTTAPTLPATTLADYCYFYMFSSCSSLTTPAIMANGTTQATPAKNCCYQMYYYCTSLNIYTSSSNHTAFYKAITYSTTSSATNYRSSYRMFYNCKINGSTSTTDYLSAGTQYYY